MKKEIYWTTNISVSIINEELFIFDEITNRVYHYRGMKKDFFLSIEKNHNLGEILANISEVYEKELSEMEKCIHNFIDKCVEHNLLRISNVC